MCTIASLSDGRLFWIIWNVFRIHSVFFPSVMVQLLRLIWGTFSVCSWFVCLLRFVLVMLIIASCSIVSHNAAQRQRTEVTFYFFQILTFQKISDSRTLTTEPREKTGDGWWLIKMFCCGCMHVGVFSPYGLVFIYNSYCFIYVHVSYIWWKYFGNVSVRSWTGVKGRWRGLCDRHGRDTSSNEANRELKKNKRISTISSIVPLVV